MLNSFAFGHYPPPDPREGRHRSTIYLRPTFELLVPGYINQIEKQIKLSSIIPQGIKQIIYNFYLIKDCDDKLFNACITGNLSEAINALKSGAKPTVTSSTTSNYRGAQPTCDIGSTKPLIICALNGYKDIADELFKSNYHFNDKLYFDGAIVLHYAASNNQYEMCELLLLKGSDPNTRDKMGRTPLMEAANIGSIECIKVLVDYFHHPGCDINQEDRSHHTALSYLIDNISYKSDPKYMKCIIYLLKNGANPNYPGKYCSKTILHFAAIIGDFELVKDLIQIYRAFIPTYDMFDKTPIDYALEHHHNEIAEYLTVESRKGKKPGCCTIL